MEDENNNEDKFQNRDYRKKPLTEQEIKEANHHTKSCSAAARYLGVAYNTYKKYALRYGLFEDQKNQEGVGISNPYNVHAGKYALDDILEGKHPGYDRFRLKRRLIRTGYKPAKCELCGFDEQRVTDGKVPIMLHNKNGDKEDLRWENLEFLCFNCYFLTVGNITGPSRNMTY